MAEKIFTGALICNICDLVFKTHREYLQHNRTIHEDKVYTESESIDNIQCENCGQFSW